ncbi:MAG TPA: 23S ribosomal RNA methyltransferase Erm [Ktedonobacterales bacterium]|nr:23S ribosomal RNA methyltransferase Erm [Ktedonobacterales bacterium]
MSSWPRERALLSQNFLRDPHVIADLLNRFDLGSDSTVYEIGPGEGLITRQLAQRFRKVVAIEKDAWLACLLQRTFRDYPNVTVVAGDFLRHPLPRSPYKVFANIPFNITSAIVTRLTAEEQSVDEAYLTMQREAARMYLGNPGESLRSILLKPWFELEIAHRFRRSDFVPSPRVDVVMLRLRKRGPPLVHAADRQLFRDFVVYMFTHWQPNHITPLNDIFTRQQRRFMERELGFDLDVKPTSISLEEWLALFDQLQQVGDAHIRRWLAGSEKRLLQQQRAIQKIHRTRTVERKM